MFLLIRIRSTYFYENCYLDVFSRCMFLYALILLSKMEHERIIKHQKIYYLILLLVMVGIITNFMKILITTI